MNDWAEMERRLRELEEKEVLPPDTLRDLRHWKESRESREKNKVVSIEAWLRKS